MTSNTETLVRNGWEYMNEINPYNKDTKQNIQNDYIQNYNLAYHNFINTLCLDNEQLKEIKNNKKLNTKHKIIIDLEGDSNIINLNSEYNIKFEKSKFLTFKNKKIKTDLINYYKPMGYFVRGPNELINTENTNKCYIELFWNSNETNETN